MNNRKLYMNFFLGFFIFFAFTLCVLNKSNTLKNNFEVHAGDGVDIKEPTKMVKINVVGQYGFFEGVMPDHADGDNVKVSSGSRAAKLAKELELSQDVLKHSVVLTPKLIYDQLKRRGANISKNLADKMISGLMTPDDWSEAYSLMESVLSEEESFKAGLAQYSNFEDFKRLCDERSKITGLYYGNVLLEQSNIYANATIDDLKQVLNDGAQFPKNVMAFFVQSKNISLALALREAGYVFNVNYIDEETNRNSLEAYIASYAQFDDGNALDAIDKLLAIGVPIKSANGTRDALDYTLENITPDNVVSRMAVARKLLDSGMPLEQSHIELLNEFKSKYPDLYGKYATNF